MANVEEEQQQRNNNNNQIALYRAYSVPDTVLDILHAYINSFNPHKTL